MKGKQVKTLLRDIVAANSNLPIQAEVISLEDDTCSVKLASGLELNDIRLKATIGSDDNYFLARPKEGSKVLLLSITGDLDDLAVIKIDEIENFEFASNGLKILIDSEDGKVKIGNDETNLKKIFQMNVDLLKMFKVFTPSGASGTALPDVVVKINEFETEFKKLLK
ncbi:hypothetical protein EIB75_10605 [Epilithonimonas vandammei]|uniref:Uncharacterized protein n=1 Tax=Epilithonimonas vandammei TaxID=2487072 RepID=A0A3G8ZEP6_9FLAO|nr:hypothetical protein [Epilithonimonas vandammei]AZI53907.1 hypothetical protein EIB75_00935 [Epilithonimonas vandammei]AZI55673.1 hypothetical protein EIB75_10605 [Epilithonimonas vandammei]